MVEGLNWNLVDMAYVTPNELWLYWKFQYFDGRVTKYCFGIDNFA